jgi:hypothetical protein
MPSPRESALIADLIALGCYEIRRSEALDGSPIEASEYRSIKVTNLGDRLGLTYRRRCPGCLVKFDGPRGLTGESLEPLLLAAIDFENRVDIEDSLRGPCGGCEIREKASGND